MSFGDYNTSNSKLWSTLAQAYSEEIKERYKELRNNFFTMEYFMSIFEGELAGKTGELFYNFDGYTKYLETPAKRAYLYMMNGNMIEWIRRWLRERFVYMDSVFGYGTISEKVTIRANRLGEVTLNLKTYSPQMVTVKFSGAQGNSKTLLVGKENWVSFTGTITTERDNEITITNAENLMYIDGISYLRPTNLLLGRAEKLVEVDTKGSPYLTRLELTNNRMLQKVDCSNCPKLGDVTAGGAGADAIDLSASVNLKYFDCSDTKISNIKFNPSGGALRTLKINRTPIKEFTLKNQEFLTSIEMEDCMSLGALTVENCNELTTLLLPNSSLRTFSVTNCDKITELDISYNGTMKTLSLDGCPNLLKLKAEGITSSDITYIDLFSCRKLEHLYLSNSSFLEGLRFNDDCSTLKTLKLNGTNIKYIKYGYAEENPTYVDLSPFTNLSTLSFNNCGVLEEIRNINLTTSSGSSLFSNCRKLKTITGSIKIKGSMSSAFLACNELVNLPANFDLTEVTSFSDAFNGCKKFTLSHVTRILSNCPKVTDMYRAFNGCSSLVTNDATPIPSTLFKSCTSLQSATYTFSGVSTLGGELPEGLFANNTKLTNVSYMFNGTSIKGSLPTDLFANCPNLTNVSYFAQNTKLEIVPNANIFANNTKLQQVIGFVSGCSSMVGRIPELIFQNNTNLQYADYFFSGCTNLVGEIPTLLFFYNTNLTTARGVFRNCSSLVSTIPQSLFRRCPRLTHTEYLFEGCSGLYGTVPNLLDGNDNVISTRAMFKDCSGIGSMGGTQEIDVDFFKGKIKLEDVREMFYNCKYVVFELPYNLFKDCKALKYVSGLFRGCEGLSGSIPENFFRAYEYDSEGNVIIEEVEVPRRDEWGEIVFDEFGDIIIDIVRREKFVENFMEEASSVFQNCRNLSGEIPSSLFSNFQKVLSLSAFFSGCRNLVGGLPDDLFEQCYFVENISSMFSGCYKLRNKYVSADSPYEFSPDLFLMCRRITNASSFMSMWGDGYYSPETRQGKIPPGLFDPLVALENASNMFVGCPIQGDIEDGMFRLNSKLTNINGMFYGSSIDNISEFAFYSSANPPVLYTPLLTNCNEAFRVSGLKGTAPRLWEKYPKATGSQCFAGTSVDNYADIPTAWK